MSMVQQREQERGSHCRSCFLLRSCITQQQKMQLWQQKSVRICYQLMLHNTKGRLP